MLKRDSGSGARPMSGREPDSRLIVLAAGGPAFPTAGCWEVTYTLDGQDALRFVLQVR